MPRELYPLGTVQRYKKMDWPHSKHKFPYILRRAGARMNREDLSLPTQNRVTLHKNKHIARSDQELTPNRHQRGVSASKDK